MSPEDFGLSRNELVEYGGQTGSIDEWYKRMVGIYGGNIGLEFMHLVSIIGEFQLAIRGESGIEFGGDDSALPDFQRSTDGQSPAGKMPELVSMLENYDHRGYFAESFVSTALF